MVLKTFKIIFLFLFCFYTFANESSIQKTNKNIDFDIESLKSLGYGDEIASYFKEGAVFLPGNQDVTIIVNGNASYSENILINKDGSLCFTDELAIKLKLKKKDTKSECADFLSIYPESKIDYKPNNSAIEITVNDDYLDKKAYGNDLAYGGFGVLSNYRMYGMDIRGSTNQKLYQGQFQSGINFSNWVLRNNSSFTSSGSSDSSYYKFNETTLSRSIEFLASQFEIGEINSEGSLFSGIPVNGLQLYTDNNYRNSKLTVPITGVSQKPATVEVRQNNRLLYRTIIPAGPFQLNNINGVSTGQPLNIKVIEDDGNIQEFNVVTSNEKKQNHIENKIFNVFLGKFRKISSDERIHTPYLGGIEGGISYANSDYLAGVQLSSKYKSFGTRINSSFGGDTPIINTGIGLLYAKSSEKDGYQIDSNINLPISFLSLGLSTLYRSRNYPTLYESLYKEEKIADQFSENENKYNVDTKTSSSISLSTSHRKLGTLSYSLGYNQYYGNKEHTYTNTISYGKKLGSVSLNVSFQSSNNMDDRTFVNVSIPINNKSTFSSQYQYYNNESTLNSTYSNYRNELLKYSVGATTGKDTNNVNTSVNATTAYSQISATGTVGEHNTRSIMLSASGALAYSGGLLATSPIQLGDTFGILHVPGQYGVRVSSMGGGTAITNHFGIAAIPNFPINRKTTIMLNTKNLPLNAKLETASFDVALARGSVFTREVPITITKQLLLTIKYPNGNPVNTANSVIDKDGNLVTVIMGNGNAIITNDAIGEPIRVKSDNGSICSVKYSVPENFNPNFLYEEVDAVCE